jgi:molybdopterin-guanine dinucleotide biosynthesis protein A
MPAAALDADSAARPIATLTGVILAGGRASRFGGAPKGLASVGGRRILDRVAQSLAATTDALLLIAHAPDAERWLPGVRVAGDVHAGRGALGGVHAALAHAATDVLVLAWDMPFVTASLLGALRDVGRDVARHTGFRQAAAAVPQHPDGHLEPLCAFYSAPCVAVAERLLQDGARRAATLAETVGAVHLSGAALARHGDPRTLLLSVNSADDLARADALAAAASDATS